MRFFSLFFITIAMLFSSCSYTTDSPNATSSFINSDTKSSSTTGYGEISKATGRAKTVHVNGYYRKDGTYVKSHYRSPPRRK
jgi:hypothetical protein